MLQILDDEYSNLQPTMPKYNALCVFTFESAYLAFKYVNVDFVFAMNEKTGKFIKCNNLKEVEEFYGIVNDKCKINNNPLDCNQFLSLGNCEKCNYNN